MKSYTEKERQGHIEEWEKGGLSKNAYAKRAGIASRTFIGWTWRRSKKEKQDFVEISPGMLALNSQEMVIEKGGITVRVSMSVGMKELQTVFMALGGVQ